MFLKDNISMTDIVWIGWIQVNYDERDYSSDTNEAVICFKYNAVIYASLILVQRESM